MPRNQRQMFIFIDEMHTLYIMEALPGFWGNRGTMAIFSGEQGNKGLKIRAAGNMGNLGEQGT